MLPLSRFDQVRWSSRTRYRPRRGPTSWLVGSSAILALYWCIKGISILSIDLVVRLLGLVSIFIIVSTVPAVYTASLPVVSNRSVKAGQGCIAPCSCGNPRKLCSSSSRVCLD